MRITPEWPKEHPDQWRPELRTRDNADLLAFYKAVVPWLPTNGRCVEIGIAWGRSLLYLASECLENRKRHAVLYGVDPWGKPAPMAGSGGTVDGAFRAMSSLVRYGLWRELEMIRLLGVESWQASLCFMPKCLDLVMIDGDHTYAGCKKDVLDWLLKVRPGGILAGHDYGNQYPGVKDAVDELLGYRVKTWERVWWVEYPERPGEQVLPDKPA